MPQYDIALIVKVKAKDYRSALIYAENLADDMNLTWDGANVTAITDYKHDNDGQRVMYLHNENVT